MIPGTLGNGASIIDPTERYPDKDAPPAVEDTHSVEPVERTSTPETLAAVPQDTLRRGSRLRNPPERLEPVMHGKRHDEL